MDPDGQIIDTAWDIANVAMDVKSLVSNIKQGKVGAAIVDGISTVVDVTAAAVPFLPGGAGMAVKAARGVDKAVDIARSSDNVVDAAKVASNNGTQAFLSKSVDGITEINVSKTSRETRRESMRQAGIPTCQQPISQSKNASGREYTYEIKEAYGTTVEKSVQLQTLDRSHSGEKHWEAGATKKNGQYNSYGWPRLDSNKPKVKY